VVSTTTGKKTVVGRWVVGVAVAITVTVALGAFWLSFAALTDLAHRSGIPVHQAWVWPVIVDGMIVMGTVAIVAMSGHEARARRFPWAVLAGGAVVSVSANATHAVIAGPADAGVPPVVAALVGAAAPLALLVATHMTVTLTRKAAPAKPARRRTRPAQPSTVVSAPDPAPVALGSKPVGPESSAEQSRNGAAGPAERGLHLVSQEALEAKGGDDDLEEWVREQAAAGGSVSGPAAVRAGVASSESTARRRLRALRATSPELFEVGAVRAGGQD